MFKESVNPTWLVAGAIIIAILILLVLLIKSNNKNIFVNNGSIEGGVDYRPTINNTTTINTYIQTGKPSEVSKKNKSFIASIADNILNFPTKIVDELTKTSSSGNSTSDQIGEMIISLLGIVFMFCIGFVITRGIIYTAIAISFLSIIYYLYLSVIKKEPVSIKLYLLQTIYLIRMYFFTLPISMYAEQIQQNSLTKESFSFWVNQFKTFIQNNNIQTTSLIILAVIYLLVSYFQLYSNLAITAERKSITWKTVIFSIVSTTILIIVSFNIEPFYIQFNELINTIRSSISG
ncbi:hypothetical protein JZO77_07645 [Enterococcus hulanensis]|uniref:hypothetical protein n=1 Tax=Enterococcus hulanensis TaxID=2559929 RepID=UPI001A8D6304|nr:hypothetical protein [Enterococcus hulanensis]MBO0456606.1 hypothetical protein [Enterococcus hulanensis]